jgi:hypothetical protein
MKHEPQVLFYIIRTMAPISQGWTTRDRFPEAAMMRFFFFLHHRIQNGSGAHPASYPGDFALGVKRPGREADNSPPYSTEVKECVELYLHSPIRLYGMVLGLSIGITLPLPVHTGSEAYTAPIQWVPGALCQGVKRLGREADNSPPYSTELKECVELYFHSPNTSSWRGAWQGTGTTSSSFYIYMK